MNDYLMCPISLEELEEVVFGMPKGKAPGPDGFQLSSFKNFGTSLIMICWRWLRSPILASRCFGL